MFGNKVQKIEKLAAKHKSGRLIKLLQDKDTQIRLAAIAGLGKCRDDDAYNALVSLLRDTDVSTRIVAAKALGELGRASARAHIDYQGKAETDEKAREAMKEAMAMLRNAEA